VYPLVAAVERLLIVLVAAIAAIARQIDVRLNTVFDFFNFFYFRKSSKSRAYPLNYSTMYPFH